MSDGSRVRRRVRLTAARLDEPMRAALRSWPGMESVRCRGRHLKLEYDAARLQWRDLQPWLEAAGLYRPVTLWQRLQAAWFRYVDNNARLNAASRSGHCCNKPPAIPRGGRR